MIRDNLMPAPAGQGNNSAGGGVHVNGGVCRLVNCLVAANRPGSTHPVSGAGVFSENAVAGILQCTIVTNEWEGLRQSGGVVGVTNSIFWANGDDAVGTITFEYSDVEDGDGAGSNGNISLDPLFVDRVDYHLASRSGCYTNGYFAGGFWIKARATSPAIDAGNPMSPYQDEPYPNGVRVNMGYDGNTPVASTKGGSGTVFMVR